MPLHVVRFKCTKASLEHYKRNDLLGCKSVNAERGLQAASSQ